MSHRIIFLGKKGSLHEFTTEQALFLAEDMVLRKRGFERALLHTLWRWRPGELAQPGCEE